jgi:hypothetical protein
MVTSLLYWFYLLLPFSFAINPTETIDLPVARVAIVVIFWIWLLQVMIKRSIFISFLDFLDTIEFFVGT